MVAALGERRLAQWMLDVGTPPTQVFELLASTAGLTHGARVVRALDVGEGLPVAVTRRPGRRPERAAS